MNNRWNFTDFVRFVQLNWAFQTIDTSNNEGSD